MYLKQQAVVWMLLFYQREYITYVILILQFSNNVYKLKNDWISENGIHSMLLNNVFL